MPVCVCRSPQQAKVLTRKPQLLPTTIELIAKDPRWANEEELNIILATHPRASIMVAEEVVTRMSDRTVREFGLDIEGLQPGRMVRSAILAGDTRTRTRRADGEGRALNWQPVTRVRPRDAVVVRVIK